MDDIPASTLDASSTGDHKALIHPPVEEPQEEKPFQPKLDAGLPKHSPGHRYDPPHPQEVVLRWARDRLPMRVADRILPKPK